MPRDLVAPEPLVETQLVRDLRAVRQRIEREEDWCGDNQFGRRAKPDGDYAVCLEWAMLGVTSVAPNRLVPVIQALELGTGGQPIPKWNDSHTHAEVLALIDRTIERVQREGK